MSSGRAPHPALWMVLYFPFGALVGFVGVALTFLATQHGLSITEGALILASQLMISWLKWLWAPVVDITLTPKRWYVISTSLAALGVLAMSAVPLERSTLGVLMLIIAASTFMNCIIGMSVEAMVARLTEPGEFGRVSAWLQTGNFGGMGLGGALGLFLIQHLSQPWMAGAVVGALFLACCLALLPLPFVSAHVSNQRPAAAVGAVCSGLWGMIRTRAGFLTALLCTLPLATGAAQSTLTQSAVAAQWGAGAGQVELVQGLLAGLITAVGCFAGGWLLRRTDALRSYATYGIAMALIAVAMAFSPRTIGMYVGWNMAYSFAEGLANAAFTAMVLTALQNSPAATGYNVFASLSNFPVWWLGLLLGWVADRRGAGAMLLTEAALGGLSVLAFVATSAALSRGPAALHATVSPSQPE